MQRSFLRSAVILLVLLVFPARVFTIDSQSRIPVSADKSKYEQEIPLILAELQNRKNLRDGTVAKADHGYNDRSDDEVYEALRLREKAIYCEGNVVSDGCDNRMEIREATETQRNLAKSALLIVHQDYIRRSDGEWILNETPYRQRYSVCPEEVFADQPSPDPRGCSGFHIGDGIVLTAGHCVNSQRVGKLAFVFDFALLSSVTDSPTLQFDDSQVYFSTEVVDRKYNRTTKEDWAIVRLDRKPSNRPTIQLSNQRVRTASTLCVVGHPVGLPMKMACGAGIRSNTHSQFFKSPLDTYGGNSGSMVFNEETGVVEGILVRGEKDFVWTGNCRRSRFCKVGDCSGEDVTRASIVRNRLVENGVGLIASTQPASR